MSADDGAPGSGSDPQYPVARIRAEAPLPTGPLPPPPPPPPQGPPPPAVAPPPGTGAGIAAAARSARRVLGTPARSCQVLVSAGATVVVLALVFVLGAGLAWWSMPAGPLSGNDSVTYLAVARNVAAGKGLTSPFGHELTGLSPAEGTPRLGATPLTAWPPLYPLALASGKVVGLSVESVSRLLNVLAAGASAVLTALLARRMGASAVAGALAGVLLLVNLSAVLSFAAVGSEALFLPLELTALVALSRAAGTPRGDPGRSVDLGVFIAAASAATLTRHAGVALIVTGMVVLSAGRSGGRSRSLALAVGAAAGALPLAAALWARNQPGWRSAPAAANRLDDLPEGARALANWFLPDQEPSAVVVAGAVMVLGAMLVVAAYAVAAPRAHHPMPVSRRDPTLRAPWQPALRTGTERQGALAVVIVFTVVYIGFVLLSGWLLDHGIPFDSRLALPLLPPILALLAAGADALVYRPTRRATQVGLAVALLVPVLVLTVANAEVSRDHIWSKPPEGVWSPPRPYPTMRSVAALPAGTVVFANQPSAVFALSQRPVLALPVLRSPMTGRPNPGADRDVDQLVGMLAGRRAVVVLDRPTVWLHSLTGEPLVGEGELRTRVPLTVLAEDDRFVVLGAPS